MAWSQCYRYFGVSDLEFEDEIAALRLAFFLASFGMFRASGKTRLLRLNDFAIIARVARGYGGLRDQGPKVLAKRQGDVEAFLTELRSCLLSLNVSATDTLTTKIALATTACVPAYDRYAVYALRQGLGVVGSPSQKGLAQLFSLRKKHINCLGSKYKHTLPFMRNLDISLMNFGQNQGG